MALSIVLTAAMPHAEMAKYWPDTVRCLAKYVERYPDSETVLNILKQCELGKRQLWLIKDENDKVCLTLITEVVIVEATGHRRLILYEIAGKRALEARHLLPVVEQWAIDTYGAAESEVIGREGWKKFAEAAGYKQTAVIYRKRLNDGRIAIDTLNPDQ